ncbi:UDP-glucuronosyltransferase 3A1-like [Exaiptasia diaphana]|uniref:Uncharacterized protein n=1 Tax=Exaiptasia diaphana TaxID=2652724 RepID=A0A913XJV5_EXADI|nr:UDP-glucuronosyltransferase 3A1-like [Exaiptasia diaphana]
MICSPFFGDHNVKYTGLGEILNVQTTTVDKLVEMINKVLTKKRYKEKADYFSRVVKMRQRTPLEEAAELIEYLHAVGNLAHLKPKGLELPFHQLYMLDVLLVLGVVFAVVLFIVVALVKRVIDLCCGALVF